MGRSSIYSIPTFPTYMTHMDPGAELDTQMCGFHTLAGTLRESFDQSFCQLEKLTKQNTQKKQEILFSLQRRNNYSLMTTPSSVSRGTGIGLSVRTKYHTHTTTGIARISNNRQSR